MTTESNEDTRWTDLCAAIRAKIDRAVAQRRASQPLERGDRVKVKPRPMCPDGYNGTVVSVTADDPSRYMVRTDDAPDGFDGVGGFLFVFDRSDLDKLEETPT